MGTITGHGIETLIVGKFEIIVTASSTPAIQKYYTKQASKMSLIVYC
jgi:hypothetical protein